jgi:uncharacterized membrane protein (DUF4010 family)
MEAVDLYLSLAVAAAAGLLIGIEREQSAPRDEAAKTFLGGARTHPLVALAGALSTLVSRGTGWPAVSISFAALSAFLVVNYAHDARTGADRGITSEAAFLLSFLLGALAVTTDVIRPPERKYFVVAAVAVVVTVLLSVKPTLNPLARRLSRVDLSATLKFLVLAVVVLPLLPDEKFGPLDAINPREIGILVVLLAGISFLGYAAIRLLGPRRGLGLTGLVGGLASSTGVTLSMSARAREEPEMGDGFALAVVLASSVMFVRMGVLIGVTNASLLRTAWLPLAAMAGVGFLVSIWFYRRSKKMEQGELQLSNPVELAQALKFAVLLTVVAVLSKAAASRFGNAGVYAAGLIAGTADVDAITLSLARLAKGGLPAGVATGSIFLAAASNTVVKAIIAASVGGWAHGRRIAAAFAIVLAAGAAVILLA